MRFARFGEKFRLWSYNSYAYTDCDGRAFVRELKLAYSRRFTLARFSLMECPRPSRQFSVQMGLRAGYYHGSLGIDLHFSRFAFDIELFKY